MCPRRHQSRELSYRCTRCTGWVHAKCSGLLNAAPYRRNEDRPQRPSNQHHHHPNHLQLLFHLPNKLVMTARSTFYSSTLMETDRTRSSIRENKVKLVVIQESKLSSKSKNPIIRKYTTVRKDRPHGHGGGLLVFIHESITCSKQPSSPNALSDPHPEELAIKADIGNTKLIISNI